MITKPKVPDGVYVLRSEMLEAWVIPYGARLMQLWWTKAPEGVRPLSLGFEEPASYKNDTMSIGAVCGRYANRIADGLLQSEDQSWQLDVNHPLGHCIHGGSEGVGQLDWTVIEHDESHITLQISLADGHMGFPGNTVITSVYELKGDTLHWRADANVDTLSPLNIIQHSYWNLDASPDVSEHHLQVNAGHYLPNDKRELPLALCDIKEHHCDFTDAKQINLALVPILDNALLLNQPSIDECSAILSVKDLSMQLYTDRPYLHVYASGSMKETDKPLGINHIQGSSICLETEDMPNGPNLGADVWYDSNKDYSHRLKLVFTPV